MAVSALPLLLLVWFSLYQLQRLPYCLSWTHPLTPKLLRRQCFVPLHLPSFTPPHLCFSNSSHKSLLPTMLSWTSSFWRPSARPPFFFSLPPPSDKSFGPLPYATLRITQVGNLMSPSSFASSSSASSTSPNRNHNVNNGSAHSDHHRSSNHNIHDDVKNNGPACLVRGNLHLASCHCWSHFWFHGEHVAPPHFSGHDLSNCEMTLALEGIFVQTAHKQLVCMLGCAVRPVPIKTTSFSYPSPSSSSSSSSNSHGNLHLYPHCTNHGCKEAIQYKQPPLPTTTDCEIFLQLVYPTNLTVRSFSTQGLISSLRKHNDPLYFAPFSMSALYMSIPSRFQYSRRHLTCQEVDHNRWETHTLGCEDIRRVFDELYLIMDYEGKGSHIPLNASSIGPFTTFIPNMTVAKAAQIHEFACVEHGNVLRVRFFLTAGLAAPSVDGKHTEYLIKSADELTVSAEGIVNKTTGQLCLIACSLKPAHLRALNASEEDDYNCNIRLYLQINPYISLSLRWIVEGRLFFSSENDKPDESSFPPLKLQTYWPSKYDKERKVSQPISYIYTRIDEVHRMYLINRTTTVRHSDGYIYPTRSSDDLCYTDMAHELSFEAMASIASRKSMHVKVEVIAVESCVLLEGQSRDDNDVLPESGFQSSFMRMGVEMWVDGHHIAAEGLYDTACGSMVLAGCTSPNAAFRGDISNVDLTNKPDCSLLINMQFPPANLGWFQKKNWKVSIASTRPTSDKLFFRPLYIVGESINTIRDIQIFYRRLESGLQLLVLCGILYCILGQLAVGKRLVDGHVFVSLTMVALQGSGMLFPLLMYLATLISENALLPVLPEDAIMELTKALINIMRFLACIALICIYIGVCKARINGQAYAKAGKSESFKAMECTVMEVCMPIYVGMFMVCMMMGAVDTMGSVSMGFSRSFWILYVTRATRWRKDMRDYGGVLVDLFLLPQAAQNFVRKANKRKSLQPKFYAGITMLQIALHGFHIWQWEALKEDVGFGFAVECALPCFALLLALTVHLQQTLEVKIAIKLLSQKRL